jgi:predicted aconitase with swiveling domain
MVLKGRVINGGSVTAEAVVLDTPFSFIGDFDAETGQLILSGHPLEGESIAGKVLVIPTGKGGTIAPWMAFDAAKRHMAPAAILCKRSEPITCECAITIDIPMLDSFEENILDIIKSGQRVHIDGESVTIE